MMTITNVELTQIKERAEKATLGPWEFDKGVKERGDRRPAVIEHFNYDHGEWFIHGDIADIEDAQFIAHAREDVPKLVAEVERLKTAIKYVIEITMDDDVWDYLQNVLQGTEQNAHIFKIGGA